MAETKVRRVSSLVGSVGLTGYKDTLNRYFKARPGAREKIFLATKFGILIEDGKFNARGDHD